MVCNFLQQSWCPVCRAEVGIAATDIQKCYADHLATIDEQLVASGKSKDEQSESKEDYERLIQSTAAHVDWDRKHGDDSYTHDDLECGALVAVVMADSKEGPIRCASVGGADTDIESVDSLSHK
jgi:hypothetical protein